MSIRFEMVGKLDLAKDSEKRKGFEELRYKKGETDKSGQIRKNDFISRTLRLTIKSNEDFFNLRIKGNLFGDENTALIKTMKKKLDGTYEGIEFKYSDREKYIGELAEFKKFVFIHGDERHEFATEYDYSMFVYSKLSNNELKDKTFKIVGEIEYSDYTNPITNETKTYTNYNINRIYVVKDDEKQFATANIELFINEDSIDDSRVIEDGIFTVSGYVPQYDGKKKSDKGYFQILEYPLNISEDKRKLKFNTLKELLNVGDCELGKIGFKVNLINRVEEVDFNASMLTDTEKDLLDLEIISLSELKNKYGSGKGGYISKMEIEGITKTYTLGCIPTTITLAELLSNCEESQEKEYELNLEDSLTDDELDDMDIFA